MLNERYMENATLFVEEFVVWAHNQKISFQRDGKYLGPMTLLTLYGEVVHERQVEMDRHVDKCRQENVCVSCGEEGFPYCPMHVNVDEEEIAKQFPMSPDSEQVDWKAL